MGWGACDPGNPRNRRRRPGIFVDWDGLGILIDTPPDLRDQLLDADISRVDAVLWTHLHADHLHGIDDLRPIGRLMGQRIDGYGEPDTLSGIRQRFRYLFEDGPGTGALYPPVLAAHPIDGPFAIAGRAIIPFDQDHGIGRSTGFRLGNMAYSTDVVGLDDAAFDVLDGIDLWIVDCLRDGKPHPTHATLSTTLGWIERLRPRRAVLTHMNHQADYETLRARCPPGVEPAYDGMVVTLETAPG
jgi:phosphoribosyl 1,2-cyclic phosphate phosphodiesterase